jgi:hypothetical protein
MVRADEEAVTPRKLLQYFLLMLIAGLVLIIVVQAEPLKRPYFLTKIADVPTTSHTHVEIIGVVELSKVEADGDRHMRVGDGKGHAVVCEAIPTLLPVTPFPVPQVGDRVRIRGISRFDLKHKWPELHPTEAIEVLPKVRP